MRPIRVPVSPSIAAECYPCREVPLNYSESRLFHSRDTGSTPVRDAKNSIQHHSLQGFNLHSRELVLARGTETRDVVLIRDFR